MATKTEGAEIREIPNESTGCFMCGQDNAHGLKMRFRTDGTRVFSDVTVAAHFRGWSDLVHGGIIAGVLDEIMAWTALVLCHRFILTRSMTVTFVRPVRIGSTLSAAGWVASRPDDRSAIVAAQLADEAGNVCARAEGDFALFTREAFAKLDILPAGELEAMSSAIGAGEP